MIDIHSLTKAPVTTKAKKAGAAKRVGNRDTSISKNLPNVVRPPKDERRKEDRRNNEEKVLVDLRSGRGRRASDREGDSHIDISV